MSDNPKHVTVRLRVPPELRDKIAASSEQYNRSMNADMVARLEQSFKLEINPTETFEFEQMKRIQLKQSAQIEDLSNMLRELIKKPS